MTDDDYQILVGQVHELVSTRRDDYVSLLDRVKDELRQFGREHGEASGIYRIYSRGGKQRGNEFKEPNKIAIKARAIAGAKSFIVTSLLSWFLTTVQQANAGDYSRA